MQKMTPEDIKAALLVSQQNGTLVEVYNFADDDTFNVGFVIATDQSFVLLMTLDWDAKVNGLTAIRLTSIHAVRSQTDYLTTISYKTKVAHQYHYFDLWHLQERLRSHDYRHRPILQTLLHEAVAEKEPVVIGTKKYKGRDDFEGVIAQLGEIKLTLHYYNEHDLSSLWEYELLLAQIDYLRVFGSQGRTTAAVLAGVFDLATGPQMG